MNCPLVRRIYDRFEEIGVRPDRVPLCIVHHLERGEALVIVIEKPNDNPVELD